ncbi:MAG: hypothetical protein ACLFU2_12415 [Opitutales bacterium]
MSISLFVIAFFAGFFRPVVGLRRWKTGRAKGPLEERADAFLAGRSPSSSLRGISMRAANLSTARCLLTGMRPLREVPVLPERPERVLKSGWEANLAGTAVIHGALLFFALS